MKKTKKKNALVIVLIVVLLALALGYAAFSTTLNINGTANGTITWDVRFQGDGEFLKADGSTTDNVHTWTAPVSTVSTTNDKITATITLLYPGDGALLKAVVVNNSTVPAKLTGFEISGVSASDPDFEVTQAAGGPTVNEVLQPNGTCTATFLVKWKQTSTATTLGPKTFTITYNYAQETTEFTGTPSHADANP